MFYNHNDKGYYKMIISIVRPWSPQEVNTKVWFPVKYCGTKRINTYSSIWFNHESFQYNQEYQPVKNQGQSTRIQESKRRSVRKNMSE